MVLHGDELGRTQEGNNNTYAQDSGISWVHWDTADQSLIDFTAALVRLRKEHPTFRRSRFFDGRPVVRGAGEPLPDIVWLQPDAAVMSPTDWDSGFGRAIAVFLNGKGIHGRDARGERVTDKNFLVLFNAGDDTVDFVLPPEEYSAYWEIVVDTVGQQADSHAREAGSTLPVDGKAVLVLRAHTPSAAEASRPLGCRVPGPRSVGGERAVGGERPVGPEPHPGPRACRSNPNEEEGSKVLTARLPSSTYRLQMRESFDLDDAAALTDYLAALGVDWAYLSPLLKASAGSDHGYDVVDHSIVDPARGGRDALDRFNRSARAQGLGILIDIVPNHVGVANPQENAWWLDVLRHGRDSRFAAYFDIDWEFGGGKVRLPILGGTLEEAIDGDELTVVGDTLRYFDTVLPLAPDTPRGTVAEVVAAQHYELMNWKRADSELNYRRFFAVNTLAGIRVELPEVFEASHVEILRWVREGIADGIRVDHPDGLADPGGYLDALAAATDNCSGLGREDPRGRRAAARVLGDGGHDRLRRARRHRPGARRPCRPRRARRPGCPPARSRAADRVDDAHPRHEAWDRRRHPALRGAAAGARVACGCRARRGGRRRCHRRTARVLPRLPVVPARRRGAPARGGGPRQAVPPRTRRDHRCAAPHPVGCRQSRPRSASSRPPAWSWRRVSKTPRSIATTGCRR